jgi:hypothetical protein
LDENNGEEKNTDGKRTCKQINRKQVNPSVQQEKNTSSADVDKRRIQLNSTSIDNEKDSIARKKALTLNVPLGDCAV